MAEFTGYLFPPKEGGIELVGIATPGKEYDVRERLQKLCFNLKEATLDIAELLEETKRNKLYEGWGFDSVLTYGETELGLKASKIRYLIKIVETCRLLGVPRTEYGGVDISKLREITSLDPKGYYYNPTTGLNEPLSIHMKTMLHESKGLSTDQISYEVLKLKGMDGSDRPVVRSFSVSQETWDKTIAPALELARKKLGSAGYDEEGHAKEYSDGVCYEVICADFLAGDHQEASVDEVDEEDE